MGKDHFFHADIPFDENRTETGIPKITDANESSTIAQQGQNHD